MNWMGGTLNHHSKHKSNFQKPRVKRRNNYGNTVKATTLPDPDALSSFRPNFLRQDDAIFTSQAAPTRFRTNGSTHELPPSARQTKLEHYKSFKPIVSKLASLQSAHTQAASGDVHISNFSVNKGTCGKSDPIFISSSESSNPEMDGEAQTEEKRVPDRSTTTLDAKLHVLLHQQDWAGLQHTVPAKINFSDSGRANFGKRRRLTRQTSHRTSYTVARPLALSILPVDTCDDGLHMTGALRIEPDGIAVKVGQDAMLKAPGFQLLSGQSHELHAELSAVQPAIGHDKFMTTASMEAAIPVHSSRHDARISCLADMRTVHGQNAASSFAVTELPQAHDIIFDAHQILSDGDFNYSLDEGNISQRIELRSPSRFLQRTSTKPPFLLSDPSHSDKFEAQVKHSQFPEVTAVTGARPISSEQESCEMDHGTNNFLSVDGVVVLPGKPSHVGQRGKADDCPPILSDSAPDESIFLWEDHGTTHGGQLPPKTSCGAFDEYGAEHLGEGQTHAPRSRASSLNSDTVWTKFILDLPSDEPETKASSPSLSIIGNISSSVTYREPDMSHEANETAKLEHSHRSVQSSGTFLNSNSRKGRQYTSIMASSLSG